MSLRPLLRSVSISSHYVVFILMLACISFLGCHRQEPRPLLPSLRCGMTRDEVTQLARERGYDTSDRSWLSRSVRTASKSSKELTLVDFTFRGGRLVAVREGRYDPRTRQIEYRTIDLCGREPPR